jgi:hypothetical protein
MLDENDCPIIVDLGSCKPFGEPLSEAGTPQWNEGFGNVSSIKKDEFRLGKLS